MLTSMGALTKFFTIRSAGFIIVFLAVLLGIFNRSGTSKIDFEPPFEQGDTFYYEIAGRQISNTTDLKHNGTMYFTVLMRNSTHIRIKEVKHETVSGISDQKLTYTEFHPVTYALIHIRSRTLEPFGISVWHWVDLTVLQTGKSHSIVGENMRLVEETFWEKGNISRPAYRFLANRSFSASSNSFSRSWYDCYYDADYGYPLLFSTHFHQWEVQSLSVSELDNRTLSRSDYYFSFVETNSTLSYRLGKDDMRPTDPIPVIGIAMLLFVMIYANLVKKEPRNPD
ncbi:MAG: hypothetical protein ACFFB3_16105 [Candidatus Hodarchaeota archaeon]